MQNYISNTVTRLGSAFALAALVGCSTIPTPTHREDECVVGEEGQGQILSVIPFSTQASEQYSLSCREGRAAAKMAYVGKTAQGNLYPKSALVALEFNRQVQDKIKTSVESGDRKAEKYYKDVVYFFEYYLNRIGGLTVGRIQEDVDKLVAEKQNSSSPKPPPPKPAPRCGTVNSIIRACTSDAPAVQ